MQELISYAKCEEASVQLIVVCMRSGGGGLAANSSVSEAAFRSWGGPECRREELYKFGKYSSSRLHSGPVWALEWEEKIAWFQRGGPEQGAQRLRTADYLINFACEVAKGTRN